MTSQIPKYGQNFRLDRLPYSPDMANRRYVLKADGDWFIRSDKTSKTWLIFNAQSPDMPVSYAGSLGAAMTKLLTGIEKGFYTVKEKADNARR